MLHIATDASNIKCIGGILVRGRHGKHVFDTSQLEAQAETHQLERNVCNIVCICDMGRAISKGKGDSLL